MAVNALNEVNGKFYITCILHIIFLKEKKDSEAQINVWNAS